MSGPTPTLDLTTRTLSVGGRCLRMQPRTVAILAALARCYPGAVTDRLLMRLHAKHAALRTDGYESMRLATLNIRRALSGVGVKGAVEPCVHRGVHAFRLTVPVEVIAADAADAQMAA